MICLLEMVIVPAFVVSAHGKTRITKTASLLLVGDAALAAAPLTGRSKFMLMQRFYAPPFIRVNRFPLKRKFVHVNDNKCPVTVLHDDDSRAEAFRRFDAQRKKFLRAETSAPITKTPTSRRRSPVIGF